jgi:hypothetical protein
MKKVSTIFVFIFTLWCFSLSAQQFDHKDVIGDYNMEIRVSGYFCTSDLSLKENGTFSYASLDTHTFISAIGKWRMDNDTIFLYDVYHPEGDKGFAAGLFLIKKIILNNRELIPLYSENKKGIEHFLKKDI